MSKKVSLSGEQLNLSDINAHYVDVAAALKGYFNPANRFYDAKFTGYSVTELTSQLQTRLEEIDRTSALSVLSAIEAVFRIDYLRRCYYTKKKDQCRVLSVNYTRKRSAGLLLKTIFYLFGNKVNRSFHYHSRT